MRNSAICLLALLTAAELLRAGVNTWTSHGPGGGNVQAVAVDPDNSGTVYVSAGNSGVFKSTDGGASWNAASSGLTGSSYSLAVDSQNPGTLYAWNGRIFKSTDGAQSWNVLSAPINVFSLVLDPQTSGTIYVGTNSGVFKSTDAGANWSAAASGLEGLGVNVLTLDPQNPATLYARVYPRSGPDTGGVFRSTDSGATWTFPLQQKLIDQAQSATHTCDEWGWYFTRVTGRDAPSPEQIACNPDGDRTSALTVDQYIADLQIFAARQPSAADFGLIAGVRAILVDPQHAGVLYAVTYRGIFKSTDGALSWNPASSGIDSRHISNVSVIAIDPVNPGTLYAGINFGGVLYGSMDGARSWSQVLFGSTNNGAVNAVAVDPKDPGTVYAGTGFGLLKSTDAAASWSPEKPGLADSNVSYLIVDPQNPGTVYAGTSSNLSVASRSTDGGTTWTSIPLPAPGLPGGFAALLAIDPQNPAVLYAAALCCNPPHPVLFKSTDGGANWLITGLAELPSPLLIDPRNPNTLYARSGLVGGGVIKSTDGGSTWKPINSGLGGTPNNAPNIFPLIIDPQNANTLYGVRYSDGQIFRTTNGGANWSSVNVGWYASLFHVAALVADPRNSGTLYAATVQFDCSDEDICPPDYWDKVATTPGQGLFRSTDGGGSWVRLEGSPIGVNIVAIDPRDSNTLYVATVYPGRVFRSTDAGATWNELSSGLTSPFVTALVVDGQSPSTVYAATQGGGVAAITFP